MSDSARGYMSMARAARWLGMEGRAPATALRRRLLRIERETGRRILVRVGEGTRRPSYRVTERILREHVPELIPVRDRLPAATRRAFVELKGKLDELHTRIDDAEARMFALAENVRALNERIDRRFPMSPSR